jgi:hypothetical protein
VTGTLNVRFGWDRNNDGDFVDVIGGNPELTTLSTLGSSCIGATFDGAGHPAVVYSSVSSVYLARDLNDDGDFADTGEDTVLDKAGGAEMEMTLNGGNRAFMAVNGFILIGVTD